MNKPNRESLVHRRSSTPDPHSLLDMPELLIGHRSIREARSTSGPATKQQEAAPLVPARSLNSIDFLMTVGRKPRQGRARSKRYLRLPMALPARCKLIIHISLGLKNERFFSPCSNAQRSSPRPTSAHPARTLAHNLGRRNITQLALTQPGKSTTSGAAGRPAARPGTHATNDLMSFDLSRLEVFA